MASELLSEEEISALVKGVDASHDRLNRSAAVEPYDIASEDSTLVTHLSALDMISDRFSRTLRSSMIAMLRYQPKIIVSELKVETFADYRQTIVPPVSLNIVKLTNLRGNMLFSLEPKIIFNALDSFFGGSGETQTEIKGMREFTPTETRVIQMLLQSIFKDLQDAWSPVYQIKFEFLSSEINPQFAHIVEDNDLVIVTEFVLEMANDISGKIQIVYPFSAMKPIRDLMRNQLQGDQSDERDVLWKEDLRNVIRDVDLELKSDLAYPQISLYELMNLKVGDIIPIKMPEKLMVQVEGVPTYEGIYGRANGNAAIEIHGLHKPDS